MRYKTEKNPLSIYIGDGVESQDCLYCCDEMLNMIVSLQGNTKVEVGEKEHTLREGELQIINKFNPFIVFRSEINVFLVFKIDPAYFNKFYPGFSDMVYRANGISGDWQLLELIAEIVMLLQSEDKEYRLQLESSILQIGLELHRNYAGDKIKHSKDSKNYNEKIAVYIGKHYCEPIMLSDLAKYVHLNEQYLSRHFSNLMGITISDYINIQRLYHSLDLLKNTDENILDIALQCGFVNVKSYYKVCKKYLGVTPSQYRTGLREKKNCLTKEQHSILRHRALENLLVCINNKDRRIPEKQVYKINVRKKAGRLNKSWSRVLAFGKASDGLKAEMRKQLRMVQEEIPFQYVRFHGIFSDDMQIYHEDEDGNAYYNFHYVDELMDFLLEINLKPFIELGFMPYKLASEGKYMFAWQANVSAPKEMEKWQALIQAFLLHLIERYTREEVLQWYFEIWNDADGVSKFYPVPPKDGFPFLKATYNSIKQVDGKFIVGGGNAFADKLYEKKTESFLQYLKQERIVLDFISLSVYGISIDRLPGEYMQTDEPLLIPQNLLADTKFVDIEENSSILYRLKELMKKSGFTGNIIINEWNLVPDPREAVNDTCFKAAYFAASMLEMDGLVQAVAYWVFSDIFEEISFKEEPFHGGIGFITRTGLKKPVYYVYELMNRLSHNVIARGEFFIVTKSEEGIISFFAYNYCGMKDYKFGGMKSENRYGCCEESVREFCLDIEGSQGHYVQNCYRINREEGSVYDTWIKMGAPKSIRQEQLRFLGNKSLYHFDTQEIFALNQVSLPVRLQPHEVILIEWVPIHTK